MKHLKEIICGSILAVVSLFAGFMLRQPQVNKLKKQVKTLVADNGRLIRLNETIQNDFSELLLQVKAQRALSFGKKKVKESLAENVVLQYSLSDYLTILLKYIRAGEKLSEDELRFLNAFEKVVNGDCLSTRDKKTIKDFTIGLHEKEIKQQVPCDCEHLLAELKYITV